MQVLAATQPDKTARATDVERLGHTLLVEALLSANQGAKQTIDEWLRAAESELPRRMKELYPRFSESELQMARLLDFRKAKEPY